MHLPDSLSPSLCLFGWCLVNMSNAKCIMYGKAAAGGLSLSLLCRMYPYMCLGYYKDLRAELNLGHRARPYTAEGCVINRKEVFGAGILNLL